MKLYINKFILIILGIFSYNDILLSVALKNEEINATEELIREHGLLNRILLIYEEIANRLKEDKYFNPKVLTNASYIIRSFVQDYHEKIIQEDYIFPIIEKQRKYKKMIKGIIKTHNIGRKLNDTIYQLSLSDLKLQKNRTALSQNIKKFAKMYRANESIENNEIFPLVHSLISPDEFKKLNNLIKDTEHSKFGQKGLKSVVPKVMKLEKSLNMDNLKLYKTIFC